MIGQTFLHYRVTAGLGQGGMGAVYRATDTKLGREVAIKVLPESFAQDRERLARFEREAKVLASLNHPNIAGIYGLEKVGDRQALILELVEGEDLSQRLSRGALPVEEALEVGRQVAEALEAAHEKGVIHRDLKPGNIKLMADGRVKVLDFGLAKTAAGDPTAAGSDSPTITADHTLPGTLLGTAGYMSPEQARGKAVDKRSDIWSFGVVLFECLTGRRLFGGETVTDSVGALLHKEPDWTRLPEQTPATIRLLVRKCLAKERRRRLHDIADARLDLEQAIADPGPSFLLPGGEARRETGGRTGVPRLAVLAIAVGAMALTWVLKPEPPPPTPPPVPVRHLPMSLGMEGWLSGANGAAVRLSPDGSTLAYVFREQGSAGRNYIYVKRFDELQPRRLAYSTNAIDFCFSPDGQWIAFRREGQAEWRRISVNDGPAEEMCQTRMQGRGISWSEDGWVIFGGQRGGGLARAPARGGEAQEPVTAPRNGVVVHYWPQYLAGGRAVLYTAHTHWREGFDEANIVVKRLPDGEERILKKGFGARYLPSGHLLYAQKGTLFAAAFDAESLTIQGAAVPVVSDLATKPGMGIAHFDVSTNGLLAYVRGGTVEFPYQWEWLDREGKREVLPLTAEFDRFKLSPDGKSLAYSESRSGKRDLFIYDLERKGVPRQLTFDSGDNNDPVWSPQGGCIVFSSRNLRRYQLCWMRVNEGGVVHPLYDSEGRAAVPNSWSMDERHLAFAEQAGDVSNGDTGWDVRLLNLAGDDASGWRLLSVTNYLATRFDEADACFSPDGRWLAYTSDESGSRQIHVRAFPTAEGGVQVTAMPDEGHLVAFWPRTGANLELILGRLQVFRAECRIEQGSFRAGNPQAWEGAMASEMFYRPRFDTFDVDPDGRRVLLRRPALQEGMQGRLKEIVLFENFSEHLRTLVPGGRP